MRIIDSEARRESVTRRLLAHRIIDEDGCWISTYKSNAKGYPLIKIKANYGVMCHQMAYELWVGELSDSSAIGVLHNCDKPECFKPECLYQGTPSDNHRDSRLRGRMLMGETAGRAKLTNAQAKAIRELRTNEGTPTEVLVELFNVSFSTVRRVLAGSTYREH